MDLKTKIEKLINLKYEGPYWDFKLQWYDENKNKNLVHDIICMANNQADEEAYIIIGVENETFNIIGVDDDPNRKNTQNIIDTLKDIKFLGGIRPLVHVETFTLDDKYLDVIVIEKSNYTPFVLSERYKDLNANNVYTRINDTNTPINRTADIDKQEFLWKKRFGINKDVMERLNYVLDDWNNWGYYDSSCQFVQGRIGAKNYIFNKYYPEFRLVLDNHSHNEWQFGTIKCFYSNHTAGSYKCDIFYNNTNIYSLFICHVDEYNKYIVLPQTKCFRLDNGREFIFYYVLLDSINGKVQKILCGENYSTESRFYGEYWLLYLKNEDDLRCFEEFFYSNADMIDYNLRNGESMIGAENIYGDISMVDINNVYHLYIEYLIKKHSDNVKDVDFTNYFNYYEYLKKD